MRALRSRLRAFAYVVSLLFVGAATWTPSTALAQVTTGSPFGGSSGAAGATLGANTFTGTQTISASNQAINLTGTNPYIQFPVGGVMYMGGSFGGRFGSNANQTPDTMVMHTGSLGNSVVMGEEADQSFDFAHPQQTNPTFFLENATTDTTQHQGLAYYGAQGRAIKTLTESAATTAVRIPVAAGAGVGGTVTFTVFAADASDQQTLSGIIQYAAVNKAGTETCATPTAAGTPLNSVSAGTLTCTFACDTAAANAVDIQFNCVSSLTQTTLDVYYRLNALGASEPLPQ